MNTVRGRARDDVSIMTACSYQQCANEATDLQHDARLVSRRLTSCRLSSSHQFSAAPLTRSQTWSPRSRMVPGMVLSRTSVMIRDTAGAVVKMALAMSVRHVTEGQLKVTARSQPNSICWTASADLPRLNALLIRL